MLTSTSYFKKWSWQKNRKKFHFSFKVIDKKKKIGSKSDADISVMLFDSTDLSPQVFTMYFLEECFYHTLFQAWCLSAGVIEVWFILAIVWIFLKLFF